VSEFHRIYNIVIGTKMNLLDFEFKRSRSVRDNIW